MTAEEAHEVALIVCHADGGYCSNCASDLIERLFKRWPEYHEQIISAYEKHFETVW